MKKVVAVFLLTALIASGLGNLASAQEDPSGDVWLRFDTSYHYTHDSDTFINQEVYGRRLWCTNLLNLLPELNEDNTIERATASFQTDIDYPWYDPQDNLVEPPPSPYQYQWYFEGIVPETSVGAGVGFMQYDPSPVPFTPGYNVSRTFDITRFEPGILDPQTQTLTLEIIPRTGMPDWFGIHVTIPQDIPFGAEIISCDRADTDEFEHEIRDDGLHLHIPTNYQEDPKNSYLYTIEILVEPGAHPVEFYPEVEICAFPDGGATITHEGDYDSYYYPYGDGAGTWTWDFWEEGAPKEYPVSVSVQEGYSVHWEGQSQELINESIVLFQTFWTHVPSGNEFKNNADVPGNISYVTQLINAPDNTGEPLSNVMLVLDTEESFDQVIPPTSGPPYEWTYDGDIPEGDIRQAFVRNFDESTLFNPGFDASRSVDQSVFSQPGIQTLTINVTPRLEFVDMLIIDVFAQANPNVIATILSVDGSGGSFLNQDGQRMMFVQETPEVDTEYTLTVTIEIMPNGLPVTYQPTVRIYDPGFTDDGGGLGTSITHPTPGAGVWTWNTEGTDQWTWLDGVARAVVFSRDSRIVNAEISIQHMSVDFDTRRPNMDRIAISEASILLGEGATYDLSVQDVVVSVDGVVIIIPAGSFIKNGNNESYHFESISGAEPQINMELDFEKGEWRLKISKIDASLIDNSDGVEVILTIGDYCAGELINMQVGGLTYITDQ